MKRSRNVALVIVGAAALGACGDSSDPGETVFQSLADCRRFYDEDVCKTKTVEAEKLHTESAPKFANRDACEAAYGKEACVETNVAPSGQTTSSSSSTSSPSSQTTQTHASGGGSWFMPAMMGYMLGRSMSTPTPLYYGPPSAVGTPEERQQRSLYSGGGYVGSTSAASASRFSASAPASASATRVATTGGFGSTGRSYSGSSSGS